MGCQCNQSFLVVLLLLACAAITTQGRQLLDLPLPSTLVALTSVEGQELFLEAKLKSDAVLLLQHFTTQVNAAFCGPASSSVVLNALPVPRPTQPPDLNPGLNRMQYGYFTQVGLTG